MNKNNITSLIKQNLRKIRQNRGLSEKDVAIMTAFSLKDYLAIEQGKKRISIEILAQLALALDVEINELLP